MRYVAVLVIAAATYLYISGQGPKVSVIAASPTPVTDFLKRPLDRTREVLRQARSRANDPALQ